MKKERYLIMGRQCVLEVLKQAPQRFECLYTNKEDDPLIEQAKALEIPISYKKKESLHNLVNSESHQGFVAALKPAIDWELAPFLKSLNLLDRSLIVMLDGITDPHNVGAIFRAGECFGVSGFILGKHNCCPVTPAVAKVSVGACELLPLVFVGSPTQAVEACRKEGYTIATLEISQEAKALHSFVFPEKTLLVLGAEGSGVQKRVSALADEKVYIPMSGVIDSLNVSQAAAVAFSHWALT